MKNRRDFLKAASSSLVIGSSALHSRAVAAVAAIDGSDEIEFIKWYDVDRSITNLENAYWNVIRLNGQRPVNIIHKCCQAISAHSLPFLLLPKSAASHELPSGRASRPLR